MRRQVFGYGIVLCFFVFLVGCTFTTGPIYTTQKLSSGKEIKVVGMGKMWSSNDDTALSLKYITDLPLDDEANLKAEVMEVWEMFRVNVEKEGLSKAIITVQAPPKGFIFTINTSRGYGFRKNPSGEWEMS
jgi:hypothetical protein